MEIFKNLALIINKWVKLSCSSIFDVQRWKFVRLYQFIILKEKKRKKIKNHKKKTLL